MKAGLKTSAGVYKEGCIRHKGKDKELQVQTGSDRAMQTERQCVLRGRRKEEVLACPFLWLEKGSWLSSK